jgi:hypothetical protein
LEKHVHRARGLHVGVVQVKTCMRSFAADHGMSLPVGE